MSSPMPNSLFGLMYQLPVDVLVSPPCIRSSRVSAITSRRCVRAFGLIKFGLLFLWRSILAAIVMIIPPNLGSSALWAVGGRSLAPQAWIRCQGWMYALVATSYQVLLTMTIDIMTQHYYTERLYLKGLLLEVLDSYQNSHRLPTIVGLSFESLKVC